MHQHSIIDITRTIFVAPCVAGIRLDYSLGEELPLFGPPLDQPLTYGFGYNSGRRRKAMDMPYFKTGKGTPYKAWHNMMRRAYGPNQAAAYEDCSVCRKWWDYQEFAAWYSVQPHAFEADGELDKDILDPLNTIYSPENCTVVPKSVNLIFKDSRELRAKLPRGVYVHSSGLGFIARISRYASVTVLGHFNTPTEAFEAYKQARQSYGQELAALYDGLIDERVISRLKNLSAHIRD
ncbi:MULTISPECIES: hypothetical protein [unclassified Pseudomonas]|uniref:hypothetical protein n=1 Tax=unclassified Pseudomonas TaxID=196821 RepID=UPI003397821C